MQATTLNPTQLFLLQMFSHIGDEERLKELKEVWLDHVRQRADEEGRRITADPDDNKFVDCAVSANAKYIISNDRHFKALDDIDFPKVNILTIHEFKEEI